MLIAAQEDFRHAFVRALFSNTSISNYTIAVLNATTATEYSTTTPETTSKDIEFLTSGIEKYPASIQELLVVASVGALASVARNEASVAHLEGCLERIRSNGASSYIRKVRSSSSR